MVLVSMPRVVRTFSPSYGTFDLAVTNFELESLSPALTLTSQYNFGRPRK